jgi:hypothetical protein
MACKHHTKKRSYGMHAWQMSKQSYVKSTKLVQHTDGKDSITLNLLISLNV